jgi:hypothetical protein
MSMQAESLQLQRESTRLLGIIAKALETKVKLTHYPSPRLRPWAKGAGRHTAGQVKRSHSCQRGEAQFRSGTQGLDDAPANATTRVGAK